MARKRRFAEGGETDNYDPDQDAADQIAEEAAKAPAKKQSFNEAFRSARKSGDSTFTWNGKKYTTEMARAKAKASDDTPEVTVSPNKDTARHGTIDRSPKWRAAVDAGSKPTPAPSRMTQQLRDAAASSRPDVKQSVSQTPPDNRKIWPHLKKGGGVKKYAKGGVADIRKASKAPMKPNPSANEDMMPKGMGEIARQTLEQGQLEAKQAAGKKRGGKVKKRLKRGGRC